MKNWQFLLGMILCTLAWLDAPASADDFRIDSMVFRDGDENAICQNLTLLIGARAYDQLHSQSPEVTVIDAQQKQMTILDPSRKLRAQLTFEQLANFVHTASTRAETSRAFVRFAARPEFKTRFATEKRLLEMKGDEMEYRVETIAAPSLAAAAQFRYFADWTARLNTLRPGLPPAARLAVNQQLFSQRHLPTVISRTVKGFDGSHQRLTSRHDYTWTLSAEDRRQAAEFDDWASRFETVNLPTILNSGR